jgi:hypothetical protein
MRCTTRLDLPKAVQLDGLSPVQAQFKYTMDCSPPLGLVLSLSPVSLLFQRKQVSTFSYGAWVSFGNQIGVQEVADIMTAAKDSGVNL